jgi:hypothetical protein
MMMMMEGDNDDDDTPGSWTYDPHRKHSAYPRYEVNPHSCFISFLIQSNNHRTVRRTITLTNKYKVMIFLFYVYMFISVESSAAE